jgi:hypothetical protein
MSRLRKSQLPFRWLTFTVSFTSGTAASVDISAYVSNPQRRTLTYSVVGSLPSGVTLTGSTLAYNGSGAAIQTTAQFRITDGIYTAESAATALTIVAVTVNTPPSWLTGASLSAVAGSTFTFPLTANDAQGDTISFIYANPTLGSVVQQPQSGQNRTLVWSGTAPTTPGTYTFVVDAVDVPPLGQVTGLTATAQSIGTISLTWSAVATATSYVVEQSPTGSSGWSQIGTPTATSLAAGGLSPGTPYWFRVRALNATQVGEFSAAATATTFSLSANATQDFVSRSTRSGVIWAHDFNSDAEVNYFLNNPLPTGEPFTTTRETDGITGGTLTINIPGNQKSPIARIEYLPDTEFGVNACRVTLATAPTDEITVAASDKLRFFGLASPWSLLNDTRNGGGGQVYIYPVFNVVSSTVFDLDLTADGVNGRAARDVSAFTAVDNPAGAVAQRCRVSSGSWNRPLSAITGATNGKGVDDRGIANEGMPARTWDTAIQTTGGINKFNRFRKDFWGHAVYQSFIDNWPDWNGATQTGMYRGGDFWVQLRVKISASRYQDANVTDFNPDLKMFGMWSTITTPSHEIFFQDMNTPQGSDDGPETAADGGIIKGYTNQSDAKTFYKRIANINREQPGGAYEASCYVNAQGDWPTDLSACWHFPPDEWVTFLIHVIAGAEEGNGSAMNGVVATDPLYEPQDSITQQWPDAPNPATATGIQLWACKQSTIDAARVAGVPARYTKIYDCVGANGFPFNYNNGLIHTPYSQAPYHTSERLNYNTAPPAWNALWLTSYQNNIPMLYGFTRKYCQVIFKKGSGASPLTTTFDPDVDGIPCPQY